MQAFLLFVTYKLLNIHNNLFRLFFSSLYSYEYIAVMFSLHSYILCQNLNNVSAQIHDSHLNNYKIHFTSSFQHHDHSSPFRALFDMFLLVMLLPLCTPPRIHLIHSSSHSSGAFLIMSILHSSYHSSSCTHR